MAKFKNGQQVRIIKEIPADTRWYFNTESMSKYLGKKATIESQHTSNREVGIIYYLKGIPGIGTWSWMERWLIPVIESREELNKQLINGEIDIQTYKELIQDVTST